jgi:hypothetical protein
VPVSVSYAPTPLRCSVIDLEPELYAGSRRRSAKEAMAEATATPETSRKLYGYALSSNSVRIAALLNEKGLQYDLVAVDLDNKTPQFLAISVRTVLHTHFF